MSETAAHQLPDHHHDHADVTAGGLRAAVFGAMDGLVSNTALVAGVAGAGKSDSTVLLTGLVGMIAGAFSMAVGEWTSIEAQNEVTERELALERTELARHPEAEEEELAEQWVARGLSPDLARQVARELSRDPEQTLRIHAEAELGIDPDRLPKVAVAALSSLCAFSAGAFVPAAPFIVGGFYALAVSLALAAVALVLVGATVARWTSVPLWKAGLRLLLRGAVTFGITFGLGSIVGSSV